MMNSGNQIGDEQTKAIIECSHNQSPNNGIAEGGPENFVGKKAGVLLKSESGDVGDADREVAEGEYKTTDEGEQEKDTPPGQREEQPKVSGYRLMGEPLCLSLLSWCQSQGAIVHILSVELTIGGLLGFGLSGGDGGIDASAIAGGDGAVEHIDDLLL